MLHFIGRRLVYAVLTLLGVATALFLLLQLTGDPSALFLPDRASDADREAFRHAHGWDRPLHVQWWRFITSMVQGDFGTSLRFRRPAIDVVLDALPSSAELAGMAIVFGLLIGVPAGIVAAWRRGRALDSMIMTGSLVGYSLPVFWLGMMLSLVFGVKLGWLPVSGRGDIRHLVLPGLTIGVGMAGSTARLLRSNLVDALNEDYIRTARAKGCSEGRVVMVHALRNASLPSLTLLGLQVALVLTGVFIVEVVYAYPGLGRLTIDAINGRDFPIVEAAIVLSGGVYVAVNLITDVLYGVLDPRIELGREARR